MEGDAFKSTSITFAQTTDFDAGSQAGRRPSSKNVCAGLENANTRLGPIGRAVPIRSKPKKAAQTWKATALGTGAAQGGQKARAFSGR
jgi:hypothetical protein